MLTGARRATLKSRRLVTFRQIPPKMAKAANLKSSTYIFACKAMMYNVMVGIGRLFDPGEAYKWAHV